MASTQAPVGYDEFSYAIRDADGATIHCGIRRSYASRAIVSDSVIGILLDTPTIDPPALAEEVRGDIEKDYPPLNFNQYHVRQDPLQHGNICFSINGEDCGVAFSHIYHGKYYPAVSMFGGATVTVNLGPNFKYAPPNIQPVSNLTIE